MKIALFVIAMFAAEPALAQAEARRGFIGFGIGPAIPFGSFADASSSNPRAGRAFPGYSSNLLNILYPIGRRFGVAVTGTYSEYVWRDGGDDDWWQMASLAVGPTYSQRLSAKAEVDLKAMLGLVTLTPVVDSRAGPGDVGGGLGVDLRATMRYNVLQRWAVFAEGGVQSAKVSFDNRERQNYLALISGLGVAYRPAW